MIRKKIIKDSFWWAQPNISKWYLDNISIPLPPLPTQKLIVQKLDLAFKNIDESIEIAKRNLENIEELNKSVLEEQLKLKNTKRVKLWDYIIFNYWKWVKKEDKIENWEIDVFWANWVMYKTNKYLFEWNSIIVWRKWSAWALNKVFWKFWASDVSYYVTVKKDISIEFTFNLLRRLNLPRFARWVKPWINRNDIYDLKIPLPSLSKQKEIVEYLDKIFEKNRVLKGKYEEKLRDLEEMKQSFLREAFENEGFVE